MTKKQEIKEYFNVGISRRERRRSIPVCVKLSEIEKQEIEKLKGRTPLSVFLRQSALNGVSSNAK